MTSIGPLAGGVPLAPWSKVAAYAAATVPSERRAAMADLRAVLSSQSTPPEEREKLTGALQRINALLLRRALPDGPDPHGRSTRVLAALNPATHVVAQQLPVSGGLLNAASILCSAWRFQPALPDVGKRLAIAALVGLVGRVALGFAMEGLSRGVHAAAERTGRARMSRATLKPINDSRGVDRTMEVTEAFEGLALRFPGPGAKEVLELMQNAFWTSIALDSAFASDFADFLTTDDATVAERKLKGNLTSGVWAQLVDMCIPEATYRAAVPKLEERRFDTADAFVSLGLQRTMPGGTSTLNDATKHALVYEALGSREPIHLDEGGLYLEVLKKLLPVVRPPMEMVCDLMEQLRQANDAASPVTHELALDRLLDELVANARAQLFPSSGAGSVRRG